ncbi:MAG: sugar phosphate isomerase/epimerase, partial [Verrucomicrobia bacterium]
RLYPRPQDALERIRNRHPGLGLCIDIGHTQRIGVNPAEAIRQAGSRVFDVHTKDVSAASPEGRTVEIGRGVIDIPAVIEALHDVGYQGFLSFEHEKDPDDPLPGLAESVGYIRGVIRMMA